jgi:uncharacterized protein (TIGR00162 family)
MSRWIIQKKFTRKPKLNKPILIEGLPGIGSVGKIAIDFIIDKVKPVLLYKIYSHEFPHSVYLTENNFVELPSVELYYFKNKKGRDLLILGGDAQPVEEKASYEFSETILNLAEEFSCSEILTLGGIGLTHEVKNARVFGAVTNKTALKVFKKMTKNVEFNSNTRVEAIFGASGLLLGLADLRGKKGMALLAETYIHPQHLGFKEARVMLLELDHMLNLNLDFSEFDKDLEELEKAAHTPPTKKTTKKSKKASERSEDLGYIS